MDLSKKVWLLNFCEGTLDGLVRCYLLDSTQGYRLLWSAVGDVKAHPELERPGIYFVVEKKSGNGKPHIYVGQATERKNKNGMLNRLKEHRRKGEFSWADDVVFLPTPEKFGSTELNYLENRFYSMVVEAGSYEEQNAIDPHRSKPRDEIMWVVESFVEDAESILAIFGHRPFLKEEVAVELPESPEPPKPPKAPKDPRKPKQPLLPLPESLKVKAKSGKQPNFSFAAVGVPVGAELKFTEAPITVTVANEKNKVSYHGKPYSLSGFVKAFHPHPCETGSYRGPKFFTYKGLTLDELRKTQSGDAEPVGEISTVATAWKNVSQLAKYLARQGGNEGAADGIGQLLTRRRPCKKGSKWRKPMEDLGIQFDEDDKVIDWTAAKGLAALPPTE